MEIRGYTIGEEIGRGDTAVVYRAFDPDGNKVALKVALDDGEYRREQMQQEADVLSWLKHEAVPDLYEIFDWDNRLCLSMQLLTGVDFDTVLNERREPFSEAQALQWGIRIAEVICMIHDHDHIYGFIAPSHIMWSTNGDVFLIDFGKVTSYSPGKQFPALGQAGYSPPEQYVGKTEPRSDVFSLGVFLYHLVTLRDPRRSHAAFLFHVVPPTEANSELTSAFEAVILRAVEHKATDRFSSMVEMHDALKRCLEV